jgi:DNA mismatch endonuclease (patch repair protein)
VTRSELMGRIRNRGNASTELALARAFHRRGVTGWRRQQRIEGVSVDFVFRKPKIAVFVDGCFWHGCAEHCRIDRLSPYWRAKIEGNAERDRRQEYPLDAMGWTVRRVWEHSLKGIK